MSSEIESHVTELRKADREAQQLVVEKDAPGLLRFLVDDATNYGPNAPAAQGRKAFAKSFQDAFDLPGFAATYPRPSKVIVASSGDLGYTVADEEITIDGADGQPVTVLSRYLAVWRRQPDGSWRIAENMWNFAEPFPPES